MKQIIFPIEFIFSYTFSPSSSNLAISPPHSKIILVDPMQVSEFAI